MRVKFITFGCKVNQYETQALSEQFINHGCQIVDNKSIADIYVINTCSVTAKADAKCREAVNRAKRQNNKAKIAVCGCLVKLNSSDLEKWGVDYLIPPEKKPSLAKIVLENKVSDADIWSLNITGFNNYRAFIKIQDGCNNCCSFCKIPYLRGQSISRPVKDVIEEVKRISLNHQEIVLCGVNLGLYGKDLLPQIKFSDLIKDLLAIDSLTRLRLSSLEPNLIDSKLLSLLDHPKFCPHLHLPFQSGDDKVLKDMNKKETVELYRQIVTRSRQINPNTAISCDIMVGFPSERDLEFKNTLEFIREIKPMRLHVFTFSPREKTPLAKVKIKNHKEVELRAKKLKALGDELAVDYAKQFIDQRLFMITQEHKNQKTLGYTQNYLLVKVNQCLPLGRLIPVKIEKVQGMDIIAKACLD